MNNIKNTLLLTVLVSVMTACSTPTNKAPIIDRLPQSTRDSGMPIAARPEDTSTQYVVKKGDTLFRIALDKGQSYSDLVSWNSLANPNDIKVGQVLRIAPPEAVSGMIHPSGVEVHPLASAGSGNNRNAPRADKRPYSDANLAEMQKTDQTDVSSPKPNSKIPEKTAEKVPEPVISDEIVWNWPAEGKIVANFDDNKNKGIDISGKMGQDVFAAAAGTVMYAGSGIRGYGNLVIIKHSNNLLSAYAHNRTIVVKEKQVITKGQKIAEMGNSDSDVVKLHFEVRQQGKPVDPLKFLPGR